MYVLFREDLISSDEIRKKIEENSKFKVISDLTKATKREDVMGFKLSIKLSDVVLDKPFNWEDDDSVDLYFKHIESMTKEFLKFFPKYTIQCSRAYKWDELEDTICLVVVIANIDITTKKLELDILKRMMKQID